MQGLLLDTQVALWLLTGNKRLNEREFRKRFLADGESRVIFHQTSTWEIQIKYELGKLPLPSRPKEFLRSAVDEAGLVYESIKDEAIYMLDRIPPIHRDPFDRLLICHAIVFNWTIVTADETLQQYPVLVEMV